MVLEGSVMFMFVEVLVKQSDVLSSDHQIVRIFSAHTLYIRPGPRPWAAAGCHVFIMCMRLCGPLQWAGAQAQALHMKFVRRLEDHWTYDNWQQVLNSIAAVPLKIHPR